MVFLDFSALFALLTPEHDINNARRGRLAQPSTEFVETELSLQSDNMRQVQRKRTEKHDLQRTSNARLETR